MLDGSKERVGKWESALSSPDYMLGVRNNRGAGTQIICEAAETNEITLMKRELR